MRCTIETMKQIHLPFKRKTNNVFFVIALGGLLFALLAFPYYLIPYVGYLSCGKNPAASNCGDGDLTGFIFLTLGVPIFALGVAGLSASYIFIKSGLDKLVSTKVLRVLTMAILTIAALWFYTWFIFWLIDNWPS